ncbi:hypothetical protein [Mycoplasma anserisalpingitidis]|uniref:hypothetical protein n=1 Tax=Mycoplasma anserisalpingitidis TaxID=519450 RepID=UPI0011B13534|nr:hypothetical protein [Mycoplasma anserisalpingitidis]QDY87733.1 hypothetical protein FOY45_02225 [Mycoplasma anserisalpingitidis]
MKEIELIIFSKKKSFIKTNNTLTISEKLQLKGITEYGDFVINSLKRQYKNRSYQFAYVYKETSEVKQRILRLILPRKNKSIDFEATNLTIKDINLQIQKYLMLNCGEYNKYQKELITKFQKNFAAYKLA